MWSARASTCRSRWRPIIRSPCRASEKPDAASINGRNKNELRYCDCEALLDRSYVLPLGDKSWPDDTRVELEYMDAPAETIGENAAADAANDALLVGNNKAEVQGA